MKPICIHSLPRSPRGPQHSTFQRSFPGEKAGRLVQKARSSAPDVSEASPREQIDVPYHPFRRCPRTPDSDAQLKTKEHPMPTVIAIEGVGPRDSGISCDTIGLLDQSDTAINIAMGATRLSYVPSLPRPPHFRWTVSRGMWKAGMHGSGHAVILQREHAPRIHMLYRKGTVCAVSNASPLPYPSQQGSVGRDPSDDTTENI